MEEVKVGKGMGKEDGGDLIEHIDIITRLEKMGVPGIEHVEHILFRVSQSDTHFTSHVAYYARNHGLIQHAVHL